MNTKHILASVGGFLFAIALEFTLPSTQAKLIGVTAAPDTSKPFFQSGASVLAEYDGPPRFAQDNFTVGLQVGHDHRGHPPAELAQLAGNTGAQAGERTEVESNRRIVAETQRLLEAEGVQVEVLPAIVPKRYTADLFLTIHADGSENTKATGFKMAAPRNDQTGKGDDIVRFLNEEYAKATNFHHDAQNITSNMRDYYAFNYRSFEHAISPATPAAIVETGFITNPQDQVLIWENPHIPAQGIANAVIRFLAQEKLEKQAQMDEPALQKL